MAGAHRTSPAPYGSGRRPGSMGEDAASRAGSATLPLAPPGGARRGSAHSEGAGALRRALLCSPAARCSRAEGAPSYPDVRSPRLSGGGGEAARTAITRETAPSCHQPSVLLLSGGVPGRDGQGAVFLEAPESHKWAQRAQRAHPGAPRFRPTQPRPLAAPPTNHTPTFTRALGGAHRHLHMASKEPRILQESPNPSLCLQAGPDLSPPRRTSVP